MTNLNRDTPKYFLNMNQHFVRKDSSEIKIFVKRKFRRVNKIVAGKTGKKSFKRNP